MPLKQKLHLQEQFYILICNRKCNLTSGLDSWLMVKTLKCPLPVLDWIGIGKSIVAAVLMSCSCDLLLFSRRCYLAYVCSPRGDVCWYLNSLFHLPPLWDKYSAISNYHNIVNHIVQPRSSKLTVRCWFCF